MTTLTDDHDQIDPLAVLGAGIDSYRPYLREDGELTDPVYGGPTQYGTPYHAWGNAVLAAHGAADRRADRIDAALRGLTAAVRQVTDPTTPIPWSGFDRRTGSPLNDAPHRDFFWPPILKTHALLCKLGADSTALDELWTRISSVDVNVAFRQRPPSNWSMVWCSGEWLRMAADGSPHPRSDLDDWLQVFFDRPKDIGFLPELGFYAERGLPNSYDLFTRVHLADMLVNGYDGRLADRVRQLLTEGMRRSLAMQLSDGSLASGYRSTGQTWTVGAQITYFRHCLALGLGTSVEQDAVRAAVDRAMINLSQWQRCGVDGAGAEFSPVQNRQPGWRRVGYEAYTADGHYANLALGFLATAVHGGLRNTPSPPRELDSRPASVRVEAEPLQRAVLHKGRISVAVQARADHIYDGNGIVDVSFGTHRFLHLISSTRHLSGGPWFNPGLGVRSQPGRTPTAVISALRHRVQRLERSAEDGITMSTVIEGRLSEGRGNERPGNERPGNERTGDVGQDDHPLAGRPYQLQVTATDKGDRVGIEVVESLPGHSFHPVLFLPYPVDVGDGIGTAVRMTDDGAELELVGAGRRERLRLVIGAPITGALDLARDYLNRRGECGLLRFDLGGPTDALCWRLISY